MAIVAGLYFPVGAVSHDPCLGYGIVFISIPFWALGAIAGSVAAYIATARDGPRRSIRRWAGVLVLLNFAAIGLVFVIPFYAS